MRAVQTRIGISLLLASLAALGCADVEGPLPKDGPLGTNKMSFEEFEAKTYREPKSGVYIVAGDTPIRDKAALKTFFDKYVQNGALTLHTEEGIEAKWDDTQKLNLTYCVGSSFGSYYSDVVTAMQIAADDWETSANINLIHLSSEDGNCDENNPNVVFDVNLAPPGSPYLARAFFPNFPREIRNILIAEESFFDVSPYTLAGILKHEVGHGLGFRHEHTRPEAGVCYEDSNWKAITGYDAESVMHYPFCNGTNTGDLHLTPIDRDGAAIVYGGHPICITLQEGVSGSSFDATVDSKKPNKNFDLDLETGDKKDPKLGLLRFDLSGVPTAARVQSATVTLHQKTNGAAGTVNVYKVTASWDESTVTWSSFASAYSPDVAASFATAAGSSKGLISFDATNLAKAWVKGPNFGLVLSENSDRTRFKTKEAQVIQKRPRLDLCYLPPASPPPMWTCNPNQYGTGDGCDCNCGFADLDCFQPNQPVNGCAAGEICTSMGTCKAVPAGWTCAADGYDAGDVCNCDCGAPDPDCDIPYNWVVGCPDWTYTCDENGQCQAPVCGDGVVSGYEECDPPDGVTCDSNCQIIYPPEASCNDLIDDDQDELYDCQDPDCQALGVCTPGSTPTGGACTAQTDCAANNNDPFCITESQSEWLNGYCSEYCDYFTNDCAAGAVCLPITSVAGLCFDGCTSNSDCRAGYSCQDFGFGTPVCWPAPETCDNGIDDDGDGAVDCDDSECYWDQACAVCGDGNITGNEECDPPDGVTCDSNCQVIYPPESACDDLLDNDNDGLHDCQDPDCQALGGCTPGSTPTGGACTVASDCTANANDPYCISEAMFAWPDGYCSEYCDNFTNDCAGDGMCLPVTANSGLCFDGCVSNADCRPGYGCQDPGVGATVCWPIPEICNNGIDDNGDGDADCADVSCANDPACAVCGDGQVTGNETCDPPDGVTCDANCHVILPPEAQCNNLVDEDADGLWDCQDPDCQALGVCTPGTTATGGACTSQNGCAATGNDPFCINETDFGWPGGYCSEYCSVSQNDCTPDAFCAAVTGGDVGLCLDGCSSDADCRAGYTCGDFGNGMGCILL
ncbi:MAG: DNRLRE domain-containing protein [Polyangiaceae bacterium]|nr:DNRLRE domain-containing protein [Polyangiaceae bacterium]